MTTTLNKTVLDPNINKALLAQLQQRLTDDGYAPEQTFKSEFGTVISYVRCKHDFLVLFYNADFEHLLGRHEGLSKTKRQQFVKRLAKKLL